MSDRKWSGRTRDGTEILASPQFRKAQSGKSLNLPLGGVKNAETVMRKRRKQFAKVSKVWSEKSKDLIGGTGR